MTRDLITAILEEIREKRREVRTYTSKSDLQELSREELLLRAAEIVARLELLHWKQKTSERTAEIRRRLELEDDDEDKRSPFARGWRAG